MSQIRYWPRDIPLPPTCLTVLVQADDYLIIAIEDVSTKGTRMNSTQMGGVVRVILGAVAAIFGTLGYMQGVDWQPIIGVLATAAVTWWSIKTNSTPAMAAAVQATDPKALVAAVAEKDPDVKVVIMKTDALAVATPALKASRKVVGPSGGTSK